MGRFAKKPDGIRFYMVNLRKDFVADRALTRNDTLVMNKLIILMNARGFVHAKQKFIADELELSEVVVSRSVRKLIARGYVRKEEYMGDSRKLRVLPSCVSKDQWNYMGIHGEDDNVSVCEPEGKD